MSGFERKLKRDQLKKQVGTNKIRDFWHTQNDTLEQRLKRGMKNARNEKV